MKLRSEIAQFIKFGSEANLDLSVLFCLKEGRWIRRFLKVITTSKLHMHAKCYFKSCVYNYNRVSFIIINAFDHSAIFMNVMKIPDSPYFEETYF